MGESENKSKISYKPQNEVEGPYRMRVLELNRMLFLMFDEICGVNEV